MTVVFQVLFDAPLLAGLGVGVITGAYGSLRATNSNRRRAAESTSLRLEKRLDRATSGPTSHRLVEDVRTIALIAHRSHSLIRFAAR